LGKVAECLPHGVAVRSGRLVPLALPTPIEPTRLSLVYHPDMRRDGRIRALVAAASLEARARSNLLLRGTTARAGGCVANGARRLRRTLKAPNEAACRSLYRRLIRGL
jgi:hypothetical protein